MIGRKEYLPSASSATVRMLPLYASDADEPLSGNREMNGENSVADKPSASIIIVPGSYITLKRVSDGV
jgi:hypothetical protein